MKSRHAVLAVFLISISLMAVMYPSLFASSYSKMKDEVEPYTTRKVEVSSTPPSTTRESARIVATGWIEGRTPNVELCTRLSEQVEKILISEGDWVTKGTALITLDSSLYRAEESVVQAEYSEAQAKLKRLENGFRKTEIEAIRSEYHARVAELEGSRKALNRLSQLLSQRATSEQSYDDELAKMRSLEAMTDAAKSRFETMAAPAREDELNAARAIVEAAEAKLELSKLNLERTTIRAPIEGRVLRINAELGELARPDDTQPLVVMSDVRQLHAVAEVDEFDSLQISIGQKAMIKVDSVKGALARGTVVRIEPIMSQKLLNMSRPGAKVDALSRRVWVALEPTQDLPIGLPIDVEFEPSLPSYKSESPSLPHSKAGLVPRQNSNWKC